MEKEENKGLQPTEAFKSIKDSIEDITTDELKASYPIFVSLAEKFKKTGQKRAMGRLMFLLRTLEKEEKILNMGITKFVYKDVIEDYINNIEKDVIKLNELKDYERVVPDEIIATVEQTKDIFDKFYVVYTDYTGKTERQVEQRRRDKDPILFGCFCDLNNRFNRFVADRFYVIGGWVDEYCDLTLDKMITNYKAARNEESPVNEITIPKDIEELKGVLSEYEIKAPEDSVTLADGEIMSVNNILADTDLPMYARKTNKPHKTSFFTKIRSFFNAKK